MALKDIINLDLQTIANDLGNPVITYKGEEYECVPSPLGDQADLEMGGLGNNSEIVFNVRVELFTDRLPLSQERLTYNNVAYRIQKVRQDVSGAFVRLLCIDIDRGT